ncbi:hypothetical protein C1645_882764, partial [Glomus cerebriforme]
MSEVTTPITPSTNTNENATTITTTIIPPNIPSDNKNRSEYQSSYSWKKDMVIINRPKERTKSEYQREFTWKNDPPSTPSPAPSPAPVTPSPIPNEFTCNTPEPIKPSISNISSINNIDFIGSKLNDLNITNITINNNISNNSTSNNHFVSEPEEFVFNTNNNIPDKWKDGLRKNSPEPRQLTLASSLDPKTKKVVALEANRLSKKSRSYSMYSLKDQLKVNETANELSNHFDTEYSREFVNWKEYGTAVREDTMASKNRQSTDHTLKRRGSWSAPAPAPTSLPAPLKWLEDLNIDLGPRASSRERLQPTITDSKSIRGISTTITAKSQLRSSRDYYDEKRPTTSAEFRDYNINNHYERPTTSADLYDRPERPTTSADLYDRPERPTTSADLYDRPRPMTSSRNYDDNDYYNSKRNNNNFDHSYSKKDRNPSPLRSYTTLGHYKETTTN